MHQSTSKAPILHIVAHPNTIHKTARVSHSSRYRKVITIEWVPLPILCFANYRRSPHRETSHPLKTEEKDRPTNTLPTMKLNVTLWSQLNPETKWYARCPSTRYTLMKYFQLGILSAPKIACHSSSQNTNPKTILGEFQFWGCNLCDFRGAIGWNKGRKRMMHITEVPFCWLTAAAAEVLCRRRAAMARVNSNAIAMTHQHRRSWTLD